jgi:hypothetical protein
MSGLTGSASSGSNPQGGSPNQTGTNSKDAPKVKYNLDCQNCFQMYKELCHATQMVKAYCIRKAIKIPYNPKIKKQMCLSFHIKGVCTNCCGFSLDHGKHTSQMDDELEKWCQMNYRVADAGGLRVATK